MLNKDELAWEGKEMPGAWAEKSVEFIWEESYHLKVSGDPESRTLKLIATVPDNSYLAIAFGSDMIGTDMILWQADGDNSASHDMWSSNFATPRHDRFDHLITTVEDGKIGTATKVFTTMRPYDPMDEQDFVVPLDE